MLVPAIAVAAIGIAGFNIANQRPAAAADCSDNSIVRCGYTTPSDLAGKVNAEIQGIYNHPVVSGYGISNMSEFAANAKHATAYKDGRLVLDDGTVVSTNGASLGRNSGGGNDHSININGKASPMTQGEQIAVRAPTNGDKAMAIEGAELVFVGYGVKAPERGWDDFKGLDAKGKILVMLVNDPDFEGGEGDFGGKAMTYYGRWTYKYEEGARQGAKGVLVIHETDPASYGWATVKNSNTNAMFDIVRQNPAADHPPLEGWIQRDLAAQLFSASGTG